jgi:signal peptidase I
MYVDYNNDKIKTPLFVKGILLLCGLLIGFFLIRFFINPYVIHDTSMEPNLNKGDIVFAMKYLEPKKGDVILFKSPLEKEQVMVKRIIGVADETVTLSNKTFIINQKPFTPSWKILREDRRVFSEKFSQRDSMPPLTIEKNHYFVVGDSPDRSFDSREFGTISKSLIIGVIIMSI